MSRSILHQSIENWLNKKNPEIEDIHFLRDPSEEHVPELLQLLFDLLPLVDKEKRQLLIEELNKHADNCRDGELLVGCVLNELIICLVSNASPDRNAMNILKNFALEHPEYLDPFVIAPRTDDTTRSVRDN